MWIEIAPRRLDFCGMPPCPLCYRWEGGGVSLTGVAKFALDLLGKAWDDLGTEERKNIEGVARRIHKDGIAVASEPPESLPPADIGMSDTLQLDGWFRERRQNATQKPCPLTCDEIADRKERREATEKAARKARDERMKEAKEIAKIFAEAQPQSGGGRGDDAYYLRGVNPDFVDWCKRRGIYDPREIAMRWQSEQQSRYMMPSMDPTKGPFFGGLGT